jgi:RNA polymerase sigma-70 factor (ECF subfamily)
MSGREEAAASFEPVRPRLLRVAYRMLGSMADAEDVVQDAFLRWLGADRPAVKEPEGFLVRTVTRLCLDALKSARHRRETYIGPWLPEPVLDTDEEIETDVTLPLLMALERLSPLERAAFLLHDVFGTDFEEVARAIGRDAAACRQLAARARRHVYEDRPRFTVDRQKGLDLAEAFFTASRSGDLAGLKSMLAADVTLVADGGGKRPAGIAPVVGFDPVMEVFARLAELLKSRTPAELIRYGLINGLPGFVTREADGVLQTTALDIREGKIAGVYVVRNPDKLRRLDATLH